MNVIDLRMDADGKKEVVVYASSSKCTVVGVLCI